MTNTPWLDTRSAAAYLGLAPKTLIEWRTARRGPRYHRLSGMRHVRYETAELDRWVRERA